MNISATVRPLLRFYNWTKPYFRYDQYWYFLGMNLKVTQTQVNQYSLKAYERVMYNESFGPAASWGVRASYNFDEFLDQAEQTETQYQSYLTANVVVDSPSFNEGSQYDLNSLTPVTVRGAVRLAP